MCFFIPYVHSFSSLSTALLVLPYIRKTKRSSFCVAAVSPSLCNQIVLLFVWLFLYLSWISFLYALNVLQKQSYLL